jgi:hypothetical protein
MAPHLHGGRLGALQQQRWTPRLNNTRTHGPCCGTRIEAMPKHRKPARRTPRSMIFHQTATQDGIITKTRTQCVDPLADCFLLHHASHPKHGKPQSLDAESRLHPLDCRREHAREMPRIRTRRTKHKTPCPARRIGALGGEFNLARAAFKGMQLNAHCADELLNRELQRIECRNRTIKDPLSSGKRSRPNRLHVLWNAPECLIEAQQRLCAKAGCKACTRAAQQISNSANIYFVHPLDDAPFKPQRAHRARFECAHSIRRPPCSRKSDRRCRV